MFDDAIDVPITQACYPRITMAQLVDIAGEPEQHRPALVLSRVRSIPIREYDLANVPLQWRHGHFSRNRSFSVRWIQRTPIYVFIAVSVIPRSPTSRSVVAAPSNGEVKRKINVGHVPDGA